MGRARRGANPELGEQVSSARVRMARVSERKARELADLIRGLTAGAALDQLGATHKPSAMPTVEGALKSAMANYTYLVRENQLESQGEVENLVVGEIYVDGGPRLKRFRPRAMGRAFGIKKPSCHVTIKLYTQA